METLVPVAEVEAAEVGEVAPVVVLLVVLMVMVMAEPICIVPRLFRRLV
jgi:hypothetical protein